VPTNITAACFGIIESNLIRKENPLRIQDRVVSYPNIGDASRLTHFERSICVRWIGDHDIPICETKHNSVQTSSVTGADLDSRVIIIDPTSNLSVDSKGVSILERK
jgi:hypothetical protein